MSSLYSPHSTVFLPNHPTSFPSSCALSPFPPLKVSSACPTRVLVLHGDPSKPNPILIGCKWDEDDFEVYD